MKNEDVKIGQHCWAREDGGLAVVLKISDDFYDICGPWENGTYAREIEIIGVIDRPAGYELTKLYYDES